MKANCSQVLVDMCREIFDYSRAIVKLELGGTVGGRAQQAFGRVWALPGLPLATPLHVMLGETHVAGSEKNSAGEGQLK